MKEILESVRNDPSYLNLWSAYKKIQDLNLTVPEDDTNTVRLAVIGSTTLEPLAACLDVKTRLEGFHVETFVGGFNTYRQEVLDKSSDLYKAKPDVVVLSIDAWSILDKMFLSNFVRMSIKERHAIQNELVDSVHSIVSRLESETSALILVNNFVIPIHLPSPVFPDGLHPDLLHSVMSV